MRRLSEKRNLNSVEIPRFVKFHGRLFSCSTLIGRKVALSFVTTSSKVIFDVQNFQPPPEKAYNNTLPSNVRWISWLLYNTASRASLGLCLQRKLGMKATVAEIDTNMWEPFGSSSHEPPVIFVVARSLPVHSSSPGNHSRFQLLHTKQRCWVLSEWGWSLVCSKKGIIITTRTTHHRNQERPFFKTFLWSLLPSSTW